MRGYHYLLFIICIILIGLIATNVFAHDLYNATVGAWDFIFKGREGGGLTIAEASPFIPKDLWESYSGIGYYLAYIAIIVLCFYIIWKPRAEYTLVAIWSIFVLAIMLAQNRFAYYYVGNGAVLVGFLGSVILDMAGWKGTSANRIVESAKKNQASAYYFLDSGNCINSIFADGQFSL